jgi:hypothetical protein
MGRRSGSKLAGGIQRVSPIRAQGRVLTVSAVAMVVYQPVGTSMPLLAASMA